MGMSLEHGKKGRDPLSELPVLYPSSMQDYPKAERAGPERERARGEAEAVEDTEES